MIPKDFRTASASEVVPSPSPTARQTVIFPQNGQARRPKTRRSGESASAAESFMNNAD